MNDKTTAAVTGLVTAIGAMLAAYGYLTPMQDQTLVTATVGAVGDGATVGGFIWGIWQSSHANNGAAAARSIAAGSPQAAASAVDALTAAGAKIDTSKMVLTGPAAPPKN